MNVTIKQLQAFVAVAKSGSFAEACHLIHLSQPALSIAIKNLEDAVGGKLLARSTRSLALTPEGAEFFPAVLADTPIGNIIPDEIQAVERNFWAGWDKLKMTLTTKVQSALTGDDGWKETTELDAAINDAMEKNNASHDWLQQHGIDPAAQMMPFMMSSQLLRRMGPAGMVASFGLAYLQGFGDMYSEFRGRGVTHKNARYAAAAAAVVAAAAAAAAAARNASVTGLARATSHSVPSSTPTESNVVRPSYSLSESTSSSVCSVAGKARLLLAATNASLNDNSPLHRWRRGE